MARRPRIDFPGAFHHVMNRGAAHQKTFKSELDRKLFLKLWEHAVSRFEIEVISFALMTNHYHVLVRSPDAQLSATMQYVGRAYTQIFNSRHGRDGALFRGRFHSVLVESETHLTRVARYIDLNPVAAGVCPLNELDRYPWTSYRYSSGTTPTPWWLSAQHLRSRFPSAQEYRNFVESGVPDVELERFYRNPPRGLPILGSDEFVHRLSTKFPDFVNDQLTIGNQPTPDIVDQLVLRFSGAARNDLQTLSRPIRPARRVAILISDSFTDHPREELADRYGFSSNRSFGNAVRRAEAELAKPDLNWLYHAVITELGEG